MFDLEGRVAIVTGGNGGIGLAIAHALAGAGASVCIWGTDEAKNDAAAAEVERRGRGVLALRCDVGDEHEVEAAVRAACDHFGRLDVCFANAATTPAPAPFIEFPTDEWRRVLRVDLDGVFFTFRAVARALVEQGGGGSLVVTGSIAADHGQPTREPYACAKAAVLALVRSLAVELARHEVRVNALVPGWVETAALRTILVDERIEEAVVRRIPLRRLGTPEELAGIAVYLASDASRYHTGDTIVVDGGYSIY
ncbi:MAG TPA: SDR family NAD(P)-dependent oxidoreductase [Acidimicrobiales bacterium]